MLSLIQEAGASTGSATTGWFTLETISRVAVILGAIATTGALVYAGRQVQLLKQQLVTDARHERISRAFEFIKRWNDPAFDGIRGKVARFFKTDPTVDEIENRRDSDPEFRAALSLVVNFLEELGIAWNRRELNRDVCFDFFGGIVLGYWDWLSDFVEEHREGVEERREGLDPKVPSRIWAEFETMHQHMEQRADEMGVDQEEG